MKFATRRNGTRDGQLVLVSNDLTRCTWSDEVPKTLQAALDEWEAASVKLRAIWDRLNTGLMDGEAFDQASVSSPLPRAYQWLDGSTCLNRVEMAWRSEGKEMPDAMRREPLMYQGGSDGFLGPRDPISVGCEDWEIDLEAEVAVVTTDIPMGASKEQAAAGICLVMLVNDVSLRGLVGSEINRAFGFIKSKPASSFSPIAATTDILGDAWRGAKLHGDVYVHVNDEPLGCLLAGEDMAFDFADLIVHAASTRNLCAGTIVGSGAFWNPSADGSPALPVADGGRGYASLADQRAVEQIQTGNAHTPYLKHNDQVRIEMLDRSGSSIFGAINQRISVQHGS